MTSGIYKLTFSSGDTYIGKSVNIDTRWDQHRDKLIKGGGSKAMQQAYNLYGFPMGEIIFECHSDHIDIVEACLISRIKPNLNTSRPPDPFAHISDDDLVSVLQQLGQSTLEHLDRINRLAHGKGEAVSLINTLERENTNLQKTIARLQICRDSEEIALDIDKKLRIKDSALKEMHVTLGILEKREKALLARIAYLNKPWWEKIFD